MKNQKGFTLIELLAVIVILGILMLIAVPSLTKYIDSSKKDTYIKTINSMVDVVRYGIINDDNNYSMQNKNKRVFILTDVELEKGSNKSPYGSFDSSYSYVLVTKTTDGYKYEVQAKDDGGYCIELMNIDELDETKIKKCNDSSMEEYPKSYKVGDQITYAGSNWYVIKDSNKDEDYVTLLKDYPLTVEEVEENAIDSSGINHLNQHTPDVTPGKAYVAGGYGGVQYYSSSTCGVNENRSVMSTNCKTDYQSSEIKYIVDNWTNNNINSNDLKALPLHSADTLSYTSRLITYDELSALGCTQSNCGDKSKSWLYDGEHTVQEYSYWTMTPIEDKSNLVYVLNKAYNSNILSSGPYSGHNLHETYLVRPVINLLKTSI